MDDQVSELNCTKESKKKRGPILVEKRPSRGQPDGRTMLEKAQDRKKRTNLEGPKGNSRSQNPFSILSNTEILNVARTVGIQTGQDTKESVSYS
jgi:hypothetical protein